MMGGATEIDTPRRALLQTPSTSERTAPAASVPRSSGAAKKKEAKCQKKSKKGKKVLKSKLKKKPLGGKPPSTPKQVAEKNENPPSQVAPGNQGGGGPMAAPAPAPDVKIERRDSQEDPLGMLARATTQDMVSDDDLDNSMRSPLPSETEGPAPPDQQVAPGPPGTKPKRKKRDKELHNRKMRFYRSLDSQAPNEPNAMIRYSVEPIVINVPQGSTTSPLAPSAMPRQLGFARSEEIGPECQSRPWMDASSVSMRATAGVQQLSSTNSSFLTLYFLLFRDPADVSEKQTNVTYHTAQDSIMIPSKDQINIF